MMGTKQFLKKILNFYTWKMIGILLKETDKPCPKTVVLEKEVSSHYSKKEGKCFSLSRVGTNFSFYLFFKYLFQKGEKERARAGAVVEGEADSLLSKDPENPRTWDHDLS